MGEASSSSGHPRQNPHVLGYGFHGAMPNSLPSANLFEQQGGANYFGELEEALMQQVATLRRTQQTATTTSTLHHGDTTPFSTTATAAATARPPPTLDIFPSWPMRSLHTPKEGSNVTADTTDSESSSKNNSNQNASSDQHVLVGDMAGQFDQIPQQEQHKTMRRLAQNREAARKSRLRKKAYIQQLESSKLKLAQMEQDIHRARSQGLLLGAPGGNTSSGAAMFDVDYARWLEEDSRRMAELHGGLHAHLPDSDLRAIVDDTLTHYDHLFNLKGMAAKADVFHLITGMWATPAERCFLWMGGFRPSELLKTLTPQLDPLTEQQVVGICNLQQSSQQAEEALSQGLDQLHQSLAETVAGGSPLDDPNVGSFMGHMAIALGQLSNLEGFVIQAARCFLAIGEYHNRLRALSSLWASRPREILVADEGNCGELSIAAHPSESQYSAF
uniref:DOG1 domain-containing protein n=1 Tax=Oryza barthii TaxID=65489 RepID=A0A0D3HIC3_9ORYZ